MLDSRRRRGKLLNESVVPDRVGAVLVLGKDTQETLELLDQRAKLVSKVQVAEVVDDIGDAAPQIEEAISFLL